MANKKWSIPLDNERRAVIPAADSPWLIHRDCQIVIAKLIAPVALVFCTMASLAYVRLTAPPKVLAPDAAAWAVESLPGSVVLAGGTFIDEMGQEVVRLAGGEQARVVLIPTAYGPTDEEGVDQFREQWGRFHPASIAILHTHDRADANDPQFVAPLKDATAVWFLGGVQSRLLDIYGETLLHQEVRRVFERGGVVGGNCAGAMALGETMIVGGEDYEDDEDVVLRPGLGIVPKMVADSHWLERNRIERLRGVIEEHPDHFGIGIDGATAVIIERGKLRVLGKSYVATVIPVAKPQAVRFDAWAEGWEVAVARPVFANTRRWTIAMVGRRLLRNPVPPYKLRPIPKLAQREEQAHFASSTEQNEPVPASFGIGTNTAARDDAGRLWGPSWERRWGDVAGAAFALCPSVAGSGSSGRDGVHKLLAGAIEAIGDIVGMSHTVVGRWHQGGPRRKRSGLWLLTAVRVSRARNTARLASPRHCECRAPSSQPEKWGHSRLDASAGTRLHIRRSGLGCIRRPQIDPRQHGDDRDNRRNLHENTKTEANWALLRHENCLPVRALHSRRAAAMRSRELITKCNENAKSADFSQCPIKDSFSADFSVDEISLSIPGITILLKISGSNFKSRVALRDFCWNAQQLTRHRLE